MRKVIHKGTASEPFRSESTKNRDRKPLRFSVANVPVEAEPQWGRIFLEKSPRIVVASDILFKFPSQAKIARLSGVGGGHLGTPKIAAIFPPASKNRSRNRRKIATLGALRFK